MKTLITILRWLVGGLFIFSGLIKVNDPVGTSIKLHEYFDIFAVDFASFFKAFVPYTLPLAVFLVVFEVALGVAVLVKFRMRITMWILLLMILFFTFLTGYSHVTGNVTDCGCFGDAIPLTPYQSFIKDIILTVMIVVLFIYRNRFLPAFGRQRMTAVVTGVATIISLWISIAAIRHLPFIDFRPYKVGVNIPENMKQQAPARYLYIMERNGETFEFEDYPTDTTYKYVDYKEIEPAIPAKITDYGFWIGEGADLQDMTQSTFEGVQMLCIAVELDNADGEGLKEFGEMAKEFERLGVFSVLITSSDVATTETYRHEYQIATPYYFGDHTLLKAIIRGNPGIVLMKDGTVLGKWHYNDFDAAREDIPELIR